MREIKHLAFIMDGNRRYASKHKMSILNGYNKGTSKALEFIGYQVKYNIKETSFFALSADNYKKRPVEEKRILKDIIDGFLKDEEIKKYFIENKFLIRIIGNTDELKKDKDFNLKDFFKIAEEINSQNKKYNYITNIAINYDGEKEIVTAVKDIAKKILAGEIKPTSINEKLIKSHLYFSESASPEVIVRTGNAPRLSGFMLWDSKYSEIYLTKKLWPEMDETDFYQIIEWFQTIERNFGK